MANEKPAYLLISSFTSEEAESLDAYIEAVDPLMEKHGGELLVAGSPNQTMIQYEGKWNAGAAMTLLRFPSIDALESFWDCAEYQEIKHLRTSIQLPNFTVAVEGAAAE